MKTSANGIAFIKKEEGFRAKPYLDQVGVPTIGYGSTVYMNGKAVKMSDPAISEAEATKLLIKKLDTRYEPAVNAAIKSVLNQNQYDALVSFTYNVGPGGIQTSTLTKRVNKNPLDPEITYWFSVWNKGTVNGKKVTLPVLVARRKREAALYFKPVAKPLPTKTAQ